MPTNTSHQLAVTLAKRFGGEIINGDAMQMYEGLPIATNKLSAKERKGVPHHLLDCLPLGDAPWTIKQFQCRSLQVIDEVRSRRKVPILVGGTHYYVQSLLSQHSTLGNTTNSLDIVEQERRWPLLKASGEEMLEELKKVDPTMAAQWHPNDKRHIRRSLEIWFTTGKRASDVYNEQRQSKTFSLIRDAEKATDSTFEKLASAAPFEPLLFWLHSSPEILKARLDDRVLTMVKAGLLAEVTAMHTMYQAARALGQSIDQDKGIWVSIGYKEFLPYILASQSKKEDVPDPILEKLRLECIEATQAHTRQYAKRQVRWIRLKLLHDLQQKDAAKNLFLLDGTDIGHWRENVEDQAVSIASRYMEGCPLPDPTLLSTVAEEMLSQVDKEKSQIAMRCDACDKTLMGEEQWSFHTRTKRHKAALRSRSKSISVHSKMGFG